MIALAWLDDLGSVSNLRRLVHSGLSFALNRYTDFVRGRVVMDVRTAGLIDQYYAAVKGARERTERSVARRP